MFQTVISNMRENTLKFGVEAAPWSFCMFYGACSVEKTSPTLGHFLPYIGLRRIKTLKYNKSKNMCIIQQHTGRGRHKWKKRQAVTFPQSWEAKRTVDLELNRCNLKRH